MSNLVLEENCIQPAENWHISSETLDPSISLSDILPFDPFGTQGSTGPNRPKIYIIGKMVSKG